MSDSFALGFNVSTELRSLSAESAGGGGISNNTIPLVFVRSSVRPCVARSSRLPTPDGVTILGIRDPTGRLRTEYFYRVPGTTRAVLVSLLK